MKKEIKICQYCRAQEIDREDLPEFTTITAGDESVDMCESCADHYL